ncbi:hypothetical protein RJ641_024903 [Dillenia turbinata]|uniref:Uncharacterized protein n=1 Tax=Dillenia turbinata TaxID=194707 RepID=A0AAN8ZMZ4_9MAGN
MGGRRPILAALALVMVLGVAMYVRLWSIDYTISSVDAELRRVFDLANKEAMDESAEWRYKYDQQIKQSLKKVEDDAGLNKRLGMLQKGCEGFRLSHRDDRVSLNNLDHSVIHSCSNSEAKRSDIEQNNV